MFEVYLAGGADFLFEQELNRLSRPARRPTFDEVKEIENING